MKKLSRRILGILALLIIVVLLGGLAVDLMAKAGVQAGTTYALGVKSTARTLHVSLLAGELRMDGLNIANPEGFETDHLMHSGQFELKMTPLSIFGETVQLQKFAIDGLDLIVEQRIGGSNVGWVSENLKRFESDAPAETEGKKVKVDRITIRNVTAHFYLLPESGITGPLTVNVPVIELTNVTSDSAGGVAIAELVRRLVPAILAAVLEKGEGVIPADLAGDLNRQVSEMTAALGEQAGQLAGQARQEAARIVTGAREAAGKAVEEILRPITDKQE